MTLVVFLRCLNEVIGIICVDMNVFGNRSIRSLNPVHHQIQSMVKDLLLGCNVAPIKWLAPSIAPTMGLHGAKEGDNHGCKVGGGCGDHRIMGPVKIGANGVHSG